MILDENVSGYIKSLEPDLPQYLSKMEQWGIEHEVPIIKKDSQQLLRFLIKSNMPENILEIGTAIGFSASLMLHYNPNANITTLEISDDRISDATNFFKENGTSDKIHIIKGDASETLELLAKDNKSFDFVFMDAAKAQYSVYLKSIKTLLRKGGILLTDNILQEGSVCESKFSVTRRDRTIHKRMREFLHDIMNDDMFNSCIIPLGDGMLISTKN